MSWGYLGFGMFCDFFLGDKIKDTDGMTLQNYKSYNNTYHTDMKPICMCITNQ